MEISIGLVVPCAYSSSGVGMDCLFGGKNPHNPCSAVPSRFSCFSICSGSGKGYLETDNGYLGPVLWMAETPRTRLRSLRTWREELVENFECWRELNWGKYKAGARKAGGNSASEGPPYRRASCMMERGGIGRNCLLFRDVWRCLEMFGEWKVFELWVKIWTLFNKYTPS